MNVSDGDWAVIVMSDIPNNVGAIVKVEHSIGIVSYEIGDYPAWRISIPTDMLLYGFDDFGNIVPTSFGFAMIADIALRRISGPSTKIDTDTKRSIDS